jgi:isopenicillin N synthase-like dioxygenase
MTDHECRIPSVDVAPLFEGPSQRRDAADRSIIQAASEIGFMTITNLPPEIPIGRETRNELLRLFSLSESEKRKLLRRMFDPGRPNVYRGWFPLQDGGATYKEGIDMGPDIAHAEFHPDPRDPLTEATPLPEEGVLPGWRTAVREYYLGMERLGGAIMRSFARSLGLPERFFDAYFSGGISTLRLIHYPSRPAASLTGNGAGDLWVEHKGRRVQMIGGAHIDSGFVTLLAQDGVEGLQARSHDGDWIDVPPLEGTLAVNFGGLLQRWSGGRIKATEHRVVSPGRQRFSIPFFYEPRVDALIAPLPIPGASAFEPFTYGDHLWAAMTKFIEFRDLADMRQPAGASARAS